ncbi:hypothetical protein [Spirosoma arcticum]
MDFSNLDEVIYRFTNGDGLGRTDAFAIRQACEGVQILKPTPKSTDRQWVDVTDKVDWLLRTTVQYRLLLLPGAGERPPRSRPAAGSTALDPRIETEEIRHF